MPKGLGIGVVAMRYNENLYHGTLLGANAAFEIRTYDLSLPPDHHTEAPPSTVQRRPRQLCNCMSTLQVHAIQMREPLTQAGFLARSCPLTAGRGSLILPPKPQNLHPKPYTLHPKPYTSTPTPRNLKPQTPYPRPQIVCSAMETG